MNAPKMIRIGLADDHEIFRDGLKLMLSREHSFEIVFEAKNGEQLVELAQKFEPEIILTDIIMPVLDGIEAVKQIVALLPATYCIALSMFNEENQIVDMLEAGANGYLLKNADKQEIVEAIHTVHSGAPYYCKTTSAKLARMISQSRYNPYLRKQPFNFNEREITIIRFICQEKTNKEIGDELCLSSRTVEGYRFKIMEKMKVKSVAGVVIYAIKNGIYKL